MESDVKKSKALISADAARKAEHRCLAALSTHAENTSSLEVTRPTGTNTPDGGHDLGVTGETNEVKTLVSDLTDKSAKKGKLKVRIDVKNGRTVSGDTVDKHAADSSRSPDCQVNLIVMTNAEGKLTPDARKKLERHKNSFEEVDTFFGVASPQGILKIEDQNKDSNNK